MIPNARLSRHEFERAVNNGLGRAKLYVNEYGLGSVSDLVLNACIRNHANDPQAEVSRASWLFSLFESTEFYGPFRQAIIGALEVETQYWDLRQHCQLLKEMAVLEDSVAQQALRKWVLGYAQEHKWIDWIGNEELIEVDGDRAVLDLARVYGNRLLFDEGDTVNHWFVTHSDHTEDYLRLLEHHAKSDEAIAVFLDYAQSNLPEPDLVSNNVKLTTKTDEKEHLKSRLSLSDILSRAQNGIGDFADGYMIFGKQATATDREAIFSRLLVSGERNEQIRLLWVFRRAPMPRMSKQVLAWANDEDAELRAAAIAALSELQHDSIHELARTKVLAGQMVYADSEVLRLFRLNYRVGDYDLIAKVLSSLELAPHDAHSLGLSILDLADRHKSGLINTLLTWVYEFTPCTVCRYRVIVLLERIGRLPEALLEECRYDASGAIRDLAQPG